jgi:hypothetical protein
LASACNIRGFLSHTEQVLSGHPKPAIKGHFKTGH